MASSINPSSAARRPGWRSVSAVEFGVEIGEYRGVVRLPRRVFQYLLMEMPTPERCVEAYHLHRTRLERIAEWKVRRRQSDTTLTLARQDDSRWGI